MLLELVEWVLKVLTEQNIPKQDQLQLAQDHQVEEVRSYLRLSAIYQLIFRTR
jgi:hypothetical protein